MSTDSWIPLHTSQKQTLYEVKVPKVLKSWQTLEDRNKVKWASVTLVSRQKDKKKIQNRKKAQASPDTHR